MPLIAIPVAALVHNPFCCYDYWPGCSYLPIECRFIGPDMCDPSFCLQWLPCCEAVRHECPPCAWLD
jgi:hypothetical protein